jgi:hypothetical protein
MLGRPKDALCVKQDQTGRTDRREELFEAPISEAQSFTVTSRQVV